MTTERKCQCGEDVTEFETRCSSCGTWFGDKHTPAEWNHIKGALRDPEFMFDDNQLALLDNMLDRLRAHLEE